MLQSNSASDDLWVRHYLKELVQSCTSKIRMQIK
ncbi:hypothetical protein T11_16707 [Trichinella zimbabwensis]|uniref:Uncharacterized protein n=1 Tax=Trichinella zimbabwensis TaxID=268475 RepID=A0A0V1GL50_9BILA|nr:hypothetical protein T11_16707 [Trichinella zimbabwensis]